MPKLSVIVPSIRPQNLLALYNSIDVKDFEMIIITPSYGIQRDIQCPTIWIQSYRSPNACQQMGLAIATGEYITFAADDGVFLPGMLDKAFKKLSIHGLIHNKNIVVGKYLEGDNPNSDMKKEDYYKFGYHNAYRIKGVPQANYIFNCGLISRGFMLELGGWDCRFEATTCAHADLGIRAQQDSCAEMILMDDPLFKCSHQPGKTGDHKPIHEAMKKDLKTFKKLYSKPRETRIDINNWQKTPEKWKARFK